MINNKKVKDIKTVHDAIVNYIIYNSTYESHEAIDCSIKKIEQSNSIEEIFKIPIDDRLFNFTSSLQWLYFICFIINVINDEKIIIPISFNILFSTNNAIIYLSNKYNAANDTFYQDYFDSDDYESE